MTRYAAMPEVPQPDLGSDGPQMWSRNLVVIYETDAEVVASVLPKPLEPVEPHVRLNVSSTEMPDGSTLGGGTFSVKCRHEETEGTYDLLMIMTTESPS